MMKMNVLGISYGIFLSSLILSCDSISTQDNSFLNANGDSSSVDKQLKQEISSLTSPIEECNQYLQDYEQYISEYVTNTKAVAQNAQDSARWKKIEQLQQSRVATSIPVACNNDSAFVKKYRLINQQYKK